MIIDKEKLIFIHIPKNAGTSIKKLLLGNKDFENIKGSWKHKTIYDIKIDNINAYNNYKKFAIVRNPYDRFISWFAYHKEYTLDNDLIKTYQWNPKIKTYDIVEIAKAPILQFRKWAENPYLDFNKEAIEKKLLKPQYLWIDNTVTVLKYENLEKELSIFLNKKIKLPLINNTSKFNIMDYYDKKTLDKVYGMYKEDFKKFNYKKL
jgi:hypothetical protein